MRVVCLVPSWTETLIEAGIDVVGRTRFCIHPAEAVKNIAVVGGTKNIDIEKIILLKPDLIILDKEENTLDIVQQLDSAELKWISTHVVDIETCATELARFSELFNQNTKLKIWSKQYLEILQRQPSKSQFKQIKNINYVIWKKPWMCVSKNTFIGSVMKYLNVELPDHEKKYFEISDAELKKSYCLFSSEPYPFKKQIPELLKNGYSGELIDGENISWYGHRNLMFLKSLK